MGEPQGGRNLIPESSFGAELPVITTSIALTNTISSPPTLHSKNLCSGQKSLRISSATPVCMSFTWNILIYFLPISPILRSTVSPTLIHSFIHLSIHSLHMLTEPFPAARAYAEHSEEDRFLATLCSAVREIGCNRKRDPTARCSKC